MERLRAVFDELAGHKVDQVVMVGDVVETGECVQETCRLLSDAGVIGVWGNHDFGFCCDVSEEIRERIFDTETRELVPEHVASARVGQYANDE